MALKFSNPPHGKPQIESASWIRVDGPGELPHPLLVRLGVADDGHLIATGILIECDGEELTASDLRLPLAGIVSEFAAQASKPSTAKRLRRERFYPGQTEESAEERAWKPDRAGLAADAIAVSELTPLTRVRPGRRGYPDTHYRAVARAYRKARREHPRAPIRALMDELHVSEPTAHRWLRTARERGYLEKRPGGG